MTPFNKTKRESKPFVRSSANFGSTIGDMWEICGLSVAFHIASL